MKTDLAGACYNFPLNIARETCSTGHVDIVSFGTNHASPVDTQSRFL